MVEEEEEGAHNSCLVAKPPQTMNEDAAADDIQSHIQHAIRYRAPHFLQQADSLTFEGVRRLLEKDLGLETCSLDKHKKFVRQCLLQSLEGANDGNDLKNSGETVEKNINSTKEEVTESLEPIQTEKDAGKPSSGDEEKMEDSPVMGLLTGDKTTKSKSEETRGTEKKVVPSEITIKKAIWKRATNIKDNSHEITSAGVRRLLEEDLKLDKYTLDPFKKFISGELDKVLTSPKAPESAPAVKKKSSEKNSHKRIPKKISTGGSSDSLDGGSEEVEDEVKSKKKVTPKGKVQKSEKLKNRKRPSMEGKISGKKRNKVAETTSGGNSDAEGGDKSEDDQSQCSAEKPVKKKEVSAPAYGKQVEDLKTIIKSCGMSVPPSVYKRAKQEPESKRKALLIKELEGILSREGLSSNPTEKEIKEARSRKERYKELEGIDLGNILSSSRRRSTASFVAPPKPKIPVESGDDDTEGTDSNGDDTQSEEFNKDDDEDSD